MNELHHDFTQDAAPARAANGGGAFRSAAPAGAILRGKADPRLLRDELLCEIFAAAVAAAPSALALTTLERRYSYREVDLFAMAIAKGLVERGVGPGDVVGLWMARGPELLIAQIAIAKTGAAWLPFDADAPVERIAVCLSDAEAKGLLTSAAFARKAGGGVTVPVLIDAEIATMGDAPAARSAPARRDPGQPRLSDLHLGFDRHAQGDRHHRAQHLPLSALGQRDLRRRRLRRGVPGRLGRLRPLDGGDLDSLSRRRDAVRRDAGDFGRDRAAAGYSGGGPGLRARHGADAARGAAARRENLAHDYSGRRGLSAGHRRALDPHRPRDLQQLRPDRGHRRRDDRGSLAEGAGDDRQADPQLQLLCRRRRAEFGRPRHRRRIADRRPRRRQGLSQARRADGREVYRQPISLGRLRPRALSLRRRGGSGRERQSRLSRPHRRSDQDPRLSRRAWRDRGGALACAGRAPRRRRAAQ